MELMVPLDNEYFYSFQTPVISLEYRIVLEFFLRASWEDALDRDDVLRTDHEETYSTDSSKIPLSFSFPIDVSSTFHGHNGSESKNTTFSRIHLQSLCLGSKKSQNCITDSSSISES
jgi:hypothetical protein